MSTNTSTTSTTSTATGSQPTSSVEPKKQLFKYLIVLDFEATCEKDQKFPNQEIIEFPSVIVNTETLEIVSTFREYCKPLIVPKLTAFCTELTGIKQETVDNADLFPNVLKRHYQWLEESLPGVIVNGQIINDQICFVTCGDWDLRQCLQKQLKLCNNIPTPNYFKKWINIKLQFTDFYSKPSYGMTNMLRELNLELEGRHHCGLSDSLNIARIVKKMLAAGCIFNIISKLK
ncbi:hypothetical protein DICPUDRAFT_33426 [Dictyostelium purpureum]|uniref:Exonuclease domain-containing protein n=1 Tax=Dictyostelium purpureum TaxID=5786 RepID=F0ZKU2_DICPU|nr:uncharacterized protein DICPUDRAFT_33426 [Dictyostelium purpureum]EGC35419.1 hypothetical protein DICPUDRAFT_33426 [Dictyostelium purpureum]|eukprot:XP_003288032.1 hypothetical protein DICPUDRAFT_33426 [Dictyostelium purpureum]